MPGWIWSLSCSAHMGNMFSGTTEREGGEYFSYYVDGAFSFQGQAAGCGGTMHDSNGSTVEAFMYRLEGNHCLTTELWGCLMGIRRAWDVGCKKIRIYCDSKEAVQLISQGRHELHEDMNLIHEIRMMINREWDVQILMIDGRDNTTADWLAKQALSMGLGLQILSASSISNLLQEVEIS